jgi:hypothetical protein
MVADLARMVPLIDAHDADVIAVEGGLRSVAVCTGGESR